MQTVTNEMVRPPARNECNLLADSNINTISNDNQSLQVYTEALSAYFVKYEHDLSLYNETSNTNNGCLLIERTINTTYNNPSTNNHYL